VFVIPRKVKEVFKKDMKMEIKKALGFPKA